jgi:hypothetical protein
VWQFSFFKNLKINTIMDNKIQRIPLTQPPDPGFRFYLGLGVFIISFFMLPVGLFLQRYAPDQFWKAFTLSIFWGSGPILKLISVGILGKASYVWIKYKFWHLFVKVIRPHQVSRLRYSIGLFMFCLPIIPTYIISYAPRFFLQAYHWRLSINIFIDTVFIISLFVLGGDFWDKLRALFSYTAKARFEQEEEGSEIATER